MDDMKKNNTTISQNQFYLKMLTIKLNMYQELSQIEPCNQQYHNKILEILTQIEEKINNCNDQ